MADSPMLTPKAKPEAKPCERCGGSGRDRDHEHPWNHFRTKACGGCNGTGREPGA